MAAGRFSRRILARTITAKLLAEPTRTQHWVKVLAAYLIEAHRIDEADLLVNDIEHELYEQSGHLVARVTSARPLSETVRESLKHMLREQTDASKVTLTEMVDPSLLGGVVARTPDAELDASVRTKLNRLATIN